MKKNILHIFFFVVITNISFAQQSVHLQLKNWYMTGNIPSAEVNWGATLSDTTMTGWTGITKNSSGYLTEISLSGKSIIGSLPNFNIPNLTHLNLSLNQLTGTIPNFNLPNLTNLNLSYNQFSGSVPNFNLLNLNELVLGYNQLTGSIPNFNLPNLTYVYLDNNQLTGSIPNFNLLPSIVGIYLHDNQLTGSIPNFTLPNLSFIYLQSNALSGTIPNFNLPLLSGLSLSDNQLSGTIPSFNLPNLFDLKLDINQLTGVIPSFDLPALNILDLSYNQLSGTIPSFSNAPYLTFLGLASNQLTGTIPNFNLPDLGTLILGYNSLTGAIPNFNFPNMFDIYLDHNQLTGSIPNFNFPIIYLMDLSHNQLSGSIPNFRLKELHNVYLNDNQLSGCIPAGIKVNCPFIGENNANISNNVGLTNQSWASYWKNATGVCPSPTIAAKLFLNHVDTTSLLMDDYVKMLQSFPTIDPYSDTLLNNTFIHINNFTKAIVSQNVLDTTGNTAVMDWVFLELRTGISGSTSVAYTKAALLQRDGNIIGADGSSPLRFENAPVGTYFVSVRHRNNLGFRTLNAYALSGTPTILNFTNNSIPLYGATPSLNVSTTIQAMVGGDANSDGSIDAFDTIIWETQNGLFDDYTNNADYNFDGSVDAFDTIIWEFNNGKFEELD